MNKNGYTKEYYIKKAQEYEAKMDPYLNDALMSQYGAILSMPTKSEFPLFFIFSFLLSFAQADYYLFKRNECYKKMKREEGMTEPIKLRKIIEYKKR